MYNKTKRGLNLTSSILSIIVGGLELIGGLVSIIAVAGLLGELLAYPEYVGIAIATIVGCVLDLGLGVAFIILGALGCKTPIAVDGVYKSTKKVDISTIVFSAIMFVFAIVCFAMGTASVFLIISFILVMVMLGLKIGALCIKDVVKDAGVTTDGKSLAVEEKIKELKHLRELGAITDEQYNAAVEKAIKDYSV